MIDRVIGLRSNFYSNYRLRILGIEWSTLLFDLCELRCTKFRRVHANSAPARRVQWPDVDLQLRRRPSSSRVGFTRLNLIVNTLILCDAPFVSTNERTNIGD